MAKSNYDTKARRYILNFLKNNAETTVSASDILNFLKENEIEINTATVYRYLNKLTTDKEVVKIMSSGKGAVYQLVPEQKGCEEHLHIKCVNCGKLAHLDCGIIDELGEHLLTEHGFDLECRDSILYGRCEKCRK